MDATHVDVPQGTALEFDWRKTASIGWWLQHLSDSYQENPLHMVTELVLIITILWLIFKSEKRPASSPDKLTPREEADIIDEWEPEPLVPSHLTQYRIQKATRRYQNRRTVSSSTSLGSLSPRRTLSDGGDLPTSSETSRATSASATSTSADSLPKDYGNLGQIYLSSPAMPRVIGAKSEQELINLSCHNYLGLSYDQRVKEAAKQTVRDYSVGSCGPRGFYGTMDIHLNLEKALSDYFGQSAVIYPDYIGLNASVITAFAKRGDLLLIDSACHFMILQGATLSRANIIWYPHNNMSFLESYLKNIQEEEQRYNRPLRRKFIISEGVFHNNGSICNLKELVRLKEEYKYRLILDDSHGLGVLHPKGSPGYWDVPTEDIDMYMASMDTALGSTGGFCVGADEITYHQRLSGPGYVFTASAPPFQCTAAEVALGIIGSDEGSEMCDRLQKNARLMRSKLRDPSSSPKRWRICGGDISPLIHLRLQTLAEDRRVDVIQELAEICREKGVLVYPSAFLPAEYGIDDRDDPKPSLRIVVMAQHSESDIEDAAAIIVETLESILGNFEDSAVESSDFDTFSDV